MALEELLYRRQSVGLAIESTPGTAETLASGDFDFVARDIAVTADIQRIAREFFRDSLDTIPTLTGRRAGGLAFTTELVGSGDHQASAPPWKNAILCCGVGETTGVFEIPIGAITNGPFVSGETVTGGTSSATGTVTVTRYTGDAKIYIHTITGTFQSGEVLTGGTSGATATTSGAGSNLGRRYAPISNGFSYGTVGWQLGSESSSKALEIRIAGAQGNLTLSTEVGDLTSMRFEFSGSLAGSQDVATFIESTEPAATPPQFFDAQVKLIEGFAADVGSVELSYGHQIGTPRSSKNSTGIRGGRISGRQGTGRIDPYGTIISGGFDAFSKWFNSSPGPLVFQVGTTAGNKFIIEAPRSQIVNVSPEDGDGLTRMNLQLELHGKNGNDHVIVVAA